jgi:pyruvate formate-lyase activating enzyme-like uncharacterized protein
MKNLDGSQKPRNSEGAVLKSKKLDKNTTEFDVDDEEIENVNNNNYKVKDYIASEVRKKIRQPLRVMKKKSKSVLRVNLF